MLHNSYLQPVQLTGKLTSDNCSPEHAIDNFDDRIMYDDITKIPQVDHNDSISSTSSISSLASSDSSSLDQVEDQFTAIPKIYSAQTLDQSFPSMMTWSRSYKTILLMWPRYLKRGKM